MTYSSSITKFLRSRSIYYRETYLTEDIKLHLYVEEVVSIFSKNATYEATIRYEPLKEHSLVRASIHTVSISSSLDKAKEYLHAWEARIKELCLFNLNAIDFNAEDILNEQH